MGLQERRLIKELKETILPKRERHITETYGATITYDVDWESFGDNYDALKRIDDLSCDNLQRALSAVAEDDLGKEALREGIKVVRLRNVADPAEMEIELKDGVLEMRCVYAANRCFADTQIGTFMMKAL